MIHRNVRGREYRSYRRGSRADLQTYIRIKHSVYSIINTGQKKKHETWRAISSGPFPLPLTRPCLIDPPTSENSISEQVTNLIYEA